jgi:hypothetical protein
MLKQIKLHLYSLHGIVTNKVQPFIQVNQNCVSHYMPSRHKGWKRYSSIYNRCYKWVDGWTVSWCTCFTPWGKNPACHNGNNVKAYGERTGIAPLILNVGTTCRWVVSSFMVWLLWPQYHWTGGWVAQRHCGCFATTENSLAPSIE